jgi:hypothetical protein
MSSQVKKSGQCVVSANYQTKITSIFIVSLPTDSVIVDHAVFVRLSVNFRFYNSKF